MKGISIILLYVFLNPVNSFAQRDDLLISGCLREIPANARVTQGANQTEFDLNKLREINYKIPTVIHVFHDGETGKLTAEQVMSGIEVINRDFKGLNIDWNTVPARFDSIKSTLSLELCLSSLDEQGNETSGILYYNDHDAAYFNKDLTQYGWDNYKYLNIYLPITVYEQPSDRTAFTNLPATFFSNNGNDGIFYSSFRWGYGTHSELELESELASIATHELGHWLNLRHTFNNGCDPPGDFVDDTPPDDSDQINFFACQEINDESCEGIGNISNYMDYNHGCKKMFTHGQVNRMLIALQLPVRSPLWSIENLVATGCIAKTEELVQVSYSSLDGYSFIFNELPIQLTFFDLSGKKIFQDNTSAHVYKLNPNSLGSNQDILIAFFQFENRTVRKKLLIR